MQNGISALCASVGDYQGTKAVIGFFYPEKNGNRYEGNTTETPGKPEFSLNGVHMEKLQTDWNIEPRRDGGCLTVSRIYYEALCSPGLVTEPAVFSSVRLN